MNRRMATVFGLMLVLALMLMAGCGKKSEVETDPAAGADTGEATEEVPEAVVPEEVEPEVDEGPDYATLDPADYGVGDVFFAFDQYDLDDESMGVLSRNARVLKEAGVVVLISGHCDERGTIEYNLALGEKRARAVRDYLVSLGVPAGQLKVTSYGESKPFSMGSNEDAWARNRRAHFERP
jgi:peptidoglycan-associated lipoprotein